jgi:hypothetical protein
MCCDVLTSCYDTDAQNFSACIHSSTMSVNEVQKCHLKNFLFTDTPKHNAISDLRNFESEKKIINILTNSTEFVLARVKAQRNELEE